MSERFSDEVLQRVLDANEKAFWAKRDEEGLYAPDANAVAAGHAAMRAVLEGQEHTPEQVAADAGLAPLIGMSQAAFDRMNAIIDEHLTRSDAIFGAASAAMIQLGLQRAALAAAREAHIRIAADLTRRLAEALAASDGSPR